MLTRHQVELIEIPQRMGVVRKNAADIKMAVDAIELSFERDYITTFVLGTGDSDFTPLVHKLRELNQRVIGIGVEASTSALLPPACDEFLFYERLEGVEPIAPQRTSRRHAQQRAPAARRARPRPQPADGGGREPARAAEEADLDVLVTQTLSGLERSTRWPGPRVDAEAHDPAQGSDVQRGRPTASAASASCCGTSPSAASSSSPTGTRQGRSRRSRFPHAGRRRGRRVRAPALGRRQAHGEVGPPHLSGLKNQCASRSPTSARSASATAASCSSRKAAAQRGLVEMEFDDDADDYVVRPGTDTPATIDQ